MLTVNISGEQVSSILRNICRIIQKYKDCSFEKEEHMSDESHKDIISGMVMQDLREVTSYVYHVCFRPDEARQWVTTINTIRESLRRDGVIDIMKNNVLPICADFYEKLAALKTERDKIVLKDNTYKRINAIGGITTHHSEVITLDCAEVSQYMMDVLDAIMKGVKTDDVIK